MAEFFARCDVVRAANGHHSPKVCHREYGSGKVERFASELGVQLEPVGMKEILTKNQQLADIFITVSC